MTQHSFNTGILNPEQFNHTLRDWLENSISHREQAPQEWLALRLREKLPDLPLAEAEAFSQDIMDYVEGIAKARADFVQAVKKRGMDRGEWFYRRLNKTGIFTEESLGVFAASLGNKLLDSTAQEINNFETEDSPPKEPLRFVPDPLRPRTGWNEDSIRDRMLDNGKLMRSLAVFGLSKLRELDVDSENPSPLPGLDKLLQEDDKRAVVALSGALKEASDKNIFDLEQVIGGNGLLYRQPKLPHEPRFPIPDFPHVPTSPMPDFPHGPTGSPIPDIPRHPMEAGLLVGMSDQALEYVRVAVRVASGEIKAEEALDELVDSGVAAAEGVAETMCRKYGSEAGEWLGNAVGGFISRWIPGSQPVCAKIGSEVGGFLGEKVAKPVKKLIKTVGEGAREIGRKVVDTVRNVRNSVVSGIKNVARNIGDSISSGLSSVGSWISSFF